MASFTLAVLPEARSGPPALRLGEREVARLISAAEAGDAVDLAADGSAHVIGITGPPGSGKSTLVDALVAHLRRLGLTVAVLAVDPSSEQSGGAVLGDRVRMSQHSTDPGVYIRSMATRGSTHGLASATRDAVRVLESAGYDVVVVETVGVGQIELDVVRLADTVAVLTVPGLGDTMQMNKAGIMEIGDVFVVNMADRPETRRCIRDLKQALMIGSRRGSQMPPVCATVAVDGTGVAELWYAIETHLRGLAATGELAARRQAHARAEFRELLERQWLAVLDDALRRWGRFDRVIAALDAHRTTPALAVRRVLEEIQTAAREEP